jgi:erythritol kinase
VLGYVDVVCTGVGGGLCDPAGEAGVSIVGSTAMHMRLVRDRSAARLNEMATGYTMAFPLPNTVAQMQSSMSATLNLDWLSAILREARETNGGTDRAALLAEINRLAASAEPGRALFHPYIASSGERGPFHDPHARAQFIGLDSRAGLGDLARAVFEGIALAARDCYEALGHTPPEIRVSGGGAKSATLRGALAAALGRPVRRSPGGEGTRGAAMIAMAALGGTSDVESCAAAWVTPHLGPAEAPDERLARLYERLFPVYREARQVMAGVWRGLAEARGEISHGA